MCDECGDAYATNTCHHTSALNTSVGFCCCCLLFFCGRLFCCCFHRVNHMQGLFKYSLETEDDDEPAPPPRLLGLHCATVAVQLLESMYNRYDDCFTPKSILRYTQCFAMYHDPLVADVVCFLFSISCLFLQDHCTFHTSVWKKKPVLNWPTI